MAEPYDLMNFSGEFENDENAAPDRIEGTSGSQPPGLLQSSVIVNSILKQSTRDNLIQLYTPVQKNKGRLKVHFGTPRVIQTPQVGGGEKAETAADSIAEKTTGGPTCQVDEGVIGDAEDRESWAERTSVLTRQDHTEYCQMAADVLHDLVLSLPVKDDADVSNSDSGILEDSAMEVTEDDGDNQPATDENESPRADSSISYSLDILAQAEELLRSLQSETTTTYGEPTDSAHDNPGTSPSQIVLATTDGEPTDGVHNNPGTSPLQSEVVTACGEPTDGAHDSLGTNQTTVDEPMDTEEPMDVDESMIQTVVQQADNDTGNTDIHTSTSTGGVDHEAVSVDGGQSDDGIAATGTHQPNTDDNVEIKQSELIHEVEVKNNQSEQIHKVVVSAVKTENHEVDATKEEPVERVPEQVVEAVDETKLPVDTGYDASVTNVQLTSAEPITQSTTTDIGLPVQAGKVDGGNSSEEEFMSADEDMDVDEAKTPNKKENRTNVVEQESPERIPPKVGYNLNFDDLDCVNPFASKNSMMNSPGNAANMTKPNMNTPQQTSSITTEVPNIDTSSENSRVNNHQLDSSLCSRETPSKLIASSVILSPNAVVMDEVVKDKNAGDIFEEKFDGLEDLESDHTEDLGDDKLKHKLFPCDELDDLDPFKPKTQIVNSPAVETLRNGDISEQNGKQSSASETAPVPDTGMVENTEGATQDDRPTTCDSHTAQELQSPALPRPKAGVYDLDSLDLDGIDPFKPKTQVFSSPDIKTGDVSNVDPFNPKSQIQNSPVMQNAGSSDPAQPKQQIHNSVEKIEVLDLDSLDPFKPKTQMMNSPDIKTDDVNPFVTKSQGLNSPVTMVTVADTSQHQSKTVETELDEFQPVETEIDACLSEMPTRKSSSEIIADNADPFKAKSQIANSPAVKDESQNNDLGGVKPAKSSDSVASKPGKGINDNDIFGDIDPFKSKIQIACSPVSVGVDLGKGDKSASAFDDIDPFKSKTQIVNSPVVKNLKFTDGAENAELDKQLENLLEKPVNKSEVLTNGSLDLLDNFENIDPFKTKCQMANSTALTSVSESSAKLGTRNQAVTMDTMDPFELLKAEIPTSPDGEVLEVQGVTRRGDQSAAAVIKNDQGLDIDDSQFVPASQVFSDPGVWEILEKFGSAPASGESQESTLSRMSLYVKFDPLVEESSAPSSNPRRISIRPKQLEKLKEIGLDETLLLLGTPPKRRRQSLNVSHMMNFTDRRKDSAHAQPGAVDILLALSPETTKVDDVDKPRPKMATSLIQDVESTSGDGLFEELKYTDSDVRKLRATWKLEYQGHVMAKEREWSGKEERLMTQLDEMNKIIHEQKEEKKKMGTAFNMYEELVLQMSAEKDDAIKQTEKVRQELDQAIKDEKSVENAFSDLHRRYEKLKAAVVGFQKNEEILKSTLTEARGKQKKTADTLLDLKKTAEKKISAVGQECEKVKHQKDAEHEKLTAQIKILTLNLEQKAEQNKQLTDICDKLLASTGQ